MKVLINGIEVDMNKLDEWKQSSLIEFANHIQENINLKLGEIAKQKVFVQLLDLEIDRQQRVNRINIGADVKKHKILNKARKDGVNLDD